MLILVSYLLGQKYKKEYNGVENVKKKEKE